MRKGYTLLEILVVTGIISIIAVTVLILLNPWQQIKKANDAKRKNDLAALQKALEDWYNDKGCYPRADEICVPSTIENVCNIPSKTALSKKCRICGTDSTSPNLSPYLNELPCDPQYPNEFYLYQVETPSCTLGATCATSACPANYCPSWYRIYTDLESISSGEGFDQQSEELGCLGGGCGLPSANVPTTTPPFGYDYGVSSPNNSLQTSDGFSCVIDNICNACGSPSYYETCLTNDNCDKNKIYATGRSCCLANPAGCP